MNKLEQLQKETSGIGFIKSYPILNKYTNRYLDIRLIELILSFQDNDQVFYMRYSDIAEKLGTKKQSIADAVCRLKKSGALNVVNTKNYNGIAGGSNSTLEVNLDVIISTITSTKEDTPIEVKTIEKEIIEVVEEINIDLDEVEDVKSITEYTDTLVRLNNGVTVNLKKIHSNIWDDIQPKKGLLKRVLNNTSQFLFDMELDEIIEEQN